MQGVKHCFLPFNSYWSYPNGHAQVRKDGRLAGFTKSTTSDILSKAKRVILY